MNIKDFFDKNVLSLLTYAYDEMDAGFQYKMLRKRACGTYLMEDHIVFKDNDGMVRQVKLTLEWDEGVR